MSEDIAGSGKRKKVVGVSKPTPLHARVSCSGRSITKAASSAHGHGRIQRDKVDPASSGKANSALGGVLGTAEDRADFGPALLAWAKHHGRRGLPWQVKDAYAVWVSEVMLQQTQVETVKAYYQRFMDKFPSLSDLAAASEDDVLSTWAGLGYYRRAKFLHKAARQVVASGQLSLPGSAAELLDLPGIGRSTAAAIASIAYGESVAIMDGNVVRVLARRWALDEDVQLSQTQAKLWHTAESLVVSSQPGLYTQSIMDLGATVCMPKAPKCDGCPFAKTCLGRASGKPEAFPVKVKKEKERRVEREVWRVLTDGEHVALVKNECEKGVWQSMLVFPSIKEVDREGAVMEGGAWSFRHVFSHYDLHVDVKVFLVEKHDLGTLSDQEGWALINKKQALDLAVPKPVRDVLIRVCNLTKEAS